MSKHKWSRYLKDLIANEDIPHPLKPVPGGNLVEGPFELLCARGVILNPTCAPTTVISDCAGAIKHQTNHYDEGALMKECPICFEHRWWQVTEEAYYTPSLLARHLYGGDK